jgi:hypothetical protein
MGQEASKQPGTQAQAAAGGSAAAGLPPAAIARHVDPSAGDAPPPPPPLEEVEEQRTASRWARATGIGAPSHSAALEAELRRMLHVRAEPGGGPAKATPGHLLRAQALAARLQTLSAPKPPLVASSLDGFMINRHDRTVDEIVRRTPLLLQSSPNGVSASRPAIPHPADAHRALAAFQTHDMSAAQHAVATAGRVADEAKALDFHAQLTKSLVIQASHAAHRAAVSIVGECDALCLAVHGVSCRTEVDTNSSPMRPTSLSNVSPAVPQRHVGLVQLVAEVTALARQIDVLLSEEDRAAVRESAAAMPVSLSTSPVPPPPVASSAAGGGFSRTRGTPGATPPAAASGASSAAATPRGAPVAS